MYDIFGDWGFLKGKMSCVWVEAIAEMTPKTGKTKVQKSPKKRLSPKKGIAKKKGNRHNLFLFKNFLK